jgi:hypothetical protein
LPDVNVSVVVAESMHVRQQRSSSDHGFTFSTVGSALVSFGKYMHIIVIDAKTIVPDTALVDIFKLLMHSAGTAYYG